MPVDISTGGARTVATAERVRRWWWHLNPHRQDRFAVLAPLAAVLLFLAAIIASFGYLRLEEIDREHEAVKRDVARRWFETNKREAALRRGNMTDDEVNDVVEKAIQESRAEQRAR